MGRHYFPSPTGLTDRPREVVDSEKKFLHVDDSASNLRRDGAQEGESPTLAILGVSTSLGVNGLFR